MTFSTKASGAVADVLQRKTSRRGFLARTAMFGTAAAVAPADIVLRPMTAYAAVCGPNATAASGYTVFCCSINDGANECPTGTFAAGWWKADSSPYCCKGGRPQARYYVDCNARCHCGGGGHFCYDGCSSCSCTHGTGSCDERRQCCNVFRYGQCHTEMPMVGAVACRVVTCTPPYELFDECSRSSATDDTTGLHTAPCLSPRGC
jgi:hypothetical protein